MATATKTTPTSQPDNTTTPPTSQPKNNTTTPTSQPNNTATTPTSHPTGSRTSGGGSTLPLDSINAPGAYVCAWSGHLLRVPEDGVSPDRSPTLDMVGSKPLLVTKISDNPFVALTKARLLASDFDIHVNF